MTPLHGRKTRAKGVKPKIFSNYLFWCNFCLPRSFIVHEGCRPGGVDVSRQFPPHIPTLVPSHFACSQVVVIVATVDAREVIVWGDRRMHAGQRMAIMKKFFDGGPLIGPELVDGSTTRSRQIVTMHRRSSISSDPLQPAASAGVKAADVGPDKGERLDGGAPFR